MRLLVMFSRETHQKIFLPEDYFNLCLFQTKFGLILPCILLKDNRNLMKQRSSMWWWIGLADFMALSHPYTAKDVANSFMENVFKLHNMPNTIVSDRDSIFTSNFWQELFTLQGEKSQMSSTYHPQSGGQIEIVSKCLEQYLRCMTGDKPKEWFKWLLLAKWWYNTSYHFSTH